MSPVILARFEGAVLFRDSSSWAVCMREGRWTYHEKIMEYSGLAINNTVLPSSCFYPRDNESFHGFDTHTRPAPPPISCLCDSIPQQDLKKPTENLTAPNCHHFSLFVFKFQQGYRAGKYFARAGGQETSEQANTGTAAGHTQRRGQVVQPHCAQQPEARAVGGAERRWEDKDTALPCFTTQSSSN